MGLRVGRLLGCKIRKERFKRERERARDRGGARGRSIIKGVHFHLFKQRFRINNLREARRCQIFTVAGFVYIYLYTERVRITTLLTNDLL